MKRVFLGILVVFMSSCGIATVQLTNYDEVYINGELHSQYNNAVDTFAEDDLFYFVFYQRGDYMQQIDAKLDTVYRKDGIIHFNYYSIDGEYVIDATPRRVDVYNMDNPVVSYRGPKQL
ncbi:MAG: hypothetical protein KAH32_00015 [Chlamydiia bacterium]|nr:hypothetical protein [Chlamydiia bacterium]